MKIIVEPIGSKGTDGLKVEISVLKFGDIHYCSDGKKYQKQFGQFDYHFMVDYR